MPFDKKTTADQQHSSKTLHSSNTPQTSQSSETSQVSVRYSQKENIAIYQGSFDPPHDVAMPEKIGDKKVILADSSDFKQQNYSSTALRNYLAQQNNFYTNSEFFPHKDKLPISKSLAKLIKEHRFYRNSALAITCFLEENKHLIPKDASLTSLREMTKDLGGLSGDAIYFLTDTKNNPRVVVKEFRTLQRFKNVMAEVTATAKLKALNLKYSTPVNTLFYQCADNDTLLAMEAVQGDTLKSLMAKIKDKKSKHYNSAEQSLHKAVALYGKVMAELNTVQLESISKLEPKEVEFYTDLLKTIMQLIVDNHRLYKTLDVKQLLTYVKTVTANLFKNPGFYGYTHGDPNPGNFFIQLDKGQVTMIDNAHLAAKWMDSEGNPKGFPANEYLESLSYLALFCRRLELDEEDTAKIQASFSKSYLSHAPKHFATKEALSFFRLFWLFRGIHNPLSILADPTAHKEFTPKPELLNNLIEQLKKEIGQKESKITEYSSNKLQKDNANTLSNNATLSGTSNIVNNKLPGYKATTSSGHFTLFGNSKKASSPRPTRDSSNSNRKLCTLKSSISHSLPGEKKKKYVPFSSNNHYLPTSLLSSSSSASASALTTRVTTNPGEKKKKYIPFFSNNHYFPKSLLSSSSSASALTTRVTTNGVKLAKLVMRK